MTKITTHVLDTAKGVPAAGISVALATQSDDGWKEVASAVTDNDGRVAALVPENVKISPGTHRLRFKVGDYFAAQGTATFYPYVEIVFTVRDEQHYHVPLLLSPFGYTTYRGS